MLHPGEMGAVIGGLLVEAGHHVRWVSEDRSPLSRARAVGHGLVEVATLAQGLQGASFVVSVVPPDHALVTAREVAAAGFDGVYLDANAIASSEVAAVGELFSGTRCQLCDGGIIGPPPRRAGTTRLVLSGPPAEEVARLFGASALDTEVLGDAVGTASAYKVGFAAWTKGTAALALVLDSYLARHGLGDLLRQEWERRDIDVAARIETARRGAVPKGWRFAGEMEQIATALADVGLPDGWFTAAADAYRRLEPFKDQFERPPSLEEVRNALGGEA